MPYTCEIVETERAILAVATQSLKPGSASQHIIAMFDIVYGWLKTAPVDRAGHNYALYRMSDDHLVMQAGVPVSTAFDDSGQVKCLTLPVMRAAKTTHVGPYDGIADANRALLAWCKDQGLERTGLSWEIYGDWNPDPEKLMTDVFVELEFA